MDLPIIFSQLLSFFKPLHFVWLTHGWIVILEMTGKHLEINNLHLTVFGSPNLGTRQKFFRMINCHYNNNKILHYAG